MKNIGRGTRIVRTLGFAALLVFIFYILTRFHVLLHEIGHASAERWVDPTREPKIFIPKSVHESTNRELEEQRDAAVRSEMAARLTKPPREWKTISELQSEDAQRWSDIPDINLGWEFLWKPVCGGVNVTRRSPDNKDKHDSFITFMGPFWGLFWTVQLAMVFVAVWFVVDDRALPAALSPEWRERRRTLGGRLCWGGAFGFLYVFCLPSLVGKLALSACKKSLALTFVAVVYVLFVEDFFYGMMPVEMFKFNATDGDGNIIWTRLVQEHTGDPSAERPIWLLVLTVALQIVCILLVAWRVALAERRAALARKNRHARDQMEQAPLLPGQGVDFI